MSIDLNVSRQVKLSLFINNRSNTKVDVQRYHPIIMKMRINIHFNEILKIAQNWYAFYHQFLLNYIKN